MAQGAGGLATYLCTEDQVDPSGQNECFRSVVCCLRNFKDRYFIKI